MTNFSGMLPPIFSPSKTTPCSTSGGKSRKYGPKYVVNLQFFAEAQHRNPYYNGKVCISRKGLIQNARSQKHAFGQIPVDSLGQVVKQADFQEMWLATPDTIEELKDSPPALLHLFCPRATPHGHRLRGSQRHLNEQAGVFRGPG